MYKEKVSKSHRKFAIFVSIEMIATALIIIVTSDSYAQTSVLDHHWIGFNGKSDNLHVNKRGEVSKPNSNPTLLQNTYLSSESDCCYFKPYDDQNSISLAIASSFQPNKEQNFSFGEVCVSGNVQLYVR